MHEAECDGRHRLTAWVGKLLFASIVIAVVLLSILCFLPPGRVVDYLSDDAYYYFQVARHIAQGQGPTFDGITVTTGFHPLYAFLLAGLARLVSAGGLGLVRAALLLNTACYFLTGWSIWVAVRYLWGRKVARWGALFWFTTPHAMLLVATGMESSLYACAVALFFAFLCRNQQRICGIGASFIDAMILGGLCGVAIVARTDGLALCMLAGIVLLVPCVPDLLRARHTPHPTTTACRSLLLHGGRASVFFVVALLPFVAWLIYAERYTGHLLQSSAQIKQVWRAQLCADMTLLQRGMFSLDIGFNWVVKSLVKTPALKVLLPFAGGLGVTLIGKKAVGRRATLHLLWLFPLALGAAYSLGFPKTWTWYFAPGMVTLSILAAGCMGVALESQRHDRLSLYARRWLPLLLVVALAESYAYLGVKAARGRNRNQRDMYATAVWMREHLPSDARVAAWNAGIFSWYSGCRVVNLDGLINNDILEEYRLGHSLGDYLVDKRINYVVDEAHMMGERLPEWGADEYAVFYEHTSRYMGPIAVWNLRD